MFFVRGKKSYSFFPLDKQKKKEYNRVWEISPKEEHYDVFY